MAALETRLGAAGLPEEASKVAKRDLARLKRMQASQPEYTVRRSSSPSADLLVYKYPCIYLKYVLRIDIMYVPISCVFHPPLCSL